MKLIKSIFILNLVVIAVRSENQDKDVALNNQDIIREALKDFSEGVSFLLTNKSKISAGANRVIYSAAQIASLSAQESNLTQEDINYLQQAVSDFEVGLVKLLENKKEFVHKNHADLLKEGLSELFYYMFSLVVLHDNVKTHLKKIFTALLKIITAIIADGGFNEKELINIQNSLHVALESKVYCYACTKRSDGLEAKESDHTSKLNEEQIQIKNSFNSILNNLINIILHPGQILIRLKNLATAATNILMAILADGKIDNQDYENLQVALENVGKKLD